MKQFKNIFAALLAAFVAAALVPLASCSNSSDSSAGFTSGWDSGDTSGGTSTTSDKTVSISGSFTIAGKTFTKIYLREAANSDGTYTKTYTMTGSGVSDNGVWGRNATSSSTAKETVLKGNSYYMKSYTIKAEDNGNGTWNLVVRNDSTGNQWIELAAIPKGTTGYVKVNGTGNYFTADDASGGSGTTTVANVNDALSIAKSKFGITGSASANYSGNQTSSVSYTFTHYVWLFGSNALYIKVSSSSDSVVYACYYGSYSKAVYNSANPTFSPYLYNDADTLVTVRPTKTFDIIHDSNLADKIGAVKTYSDYGFIFGIKSSAIVYDGAEI